jgi:arabinogalactan endo-1,4-beta-galactosidase
VDPSGGWCNTYDVAVKALRAKNLGMRIMIDFHYSDVWADPGHQTKPAAWANETVDSLVSTLSGYTSYVLDTLQSIGIFADWVQVGNETDNGMLWPTAMASDSLPNYARLINAGYNAVKSVNDSTKVIVHLSGGNDNNHFRWLFDQLDSFGVQYDIIGMSLYPPTGGWQAEDSECLANMNDMVNRYHKQVMVCEVGMPADSAFTCEAFLTDMIARIKSVSGGNGLGLFYWEPECYNWEGYTMGAFDSTGRPTVALNAFLH